MRHRRFLTFASLRYRRKGFDHIQVADRQAQLQLIEALSHEGIETFDLTKFPAYPTGIDVVTVRHKDALRSLQIRDRTTTEPAS